MIVRVYMFVAARKKHCWADEAGAALFRNLFMYSCRGRCLCKGHRVQRCESVECM
jgi:hypothetical protein